MKNKYYTIFFASDRNDYSRSFRISKNGFRVLLLFGILSLVLVFFGLLQIKNWIQLGQELKISKNNSLLLKDIINDLEFSMDIDSSINYEAFINKYYSYHNLEFPNIAPVKGYVTRGLHLDNNHMGIDIAAKNKDDVIAPADGKVIFSGKSEDLGNTVIINHSGGYLTVYGHNDTIFVKSGELVSKKQVISNVGETGKSQGPHLHFEIWKNNRVLDPREIIPEYKEKDVSIRQTGR